MFDANQDVHFKDKLYKNYKYNLVYLRGPFTPHQILIQVYNIFNPVSLNKILFV
ncbi:hypothetical protein pb186bvf_013344 [Paramecium bursaria]